MKEKIKAVKELSEKLLELLGTKAKIEVDADDDQTVNVNIDSKEETGLLIGRRGETLSSIQMVLSLMARQKLGGWVRIVVNVGDYREKEEESLQNLALETAQRAKQTGEPQRLYNLTPGQRRIVHIALSEDTEIETESVGEEEERYLVVRPKK